MRWMLKTFLYFALFRCPTCWRRMVRINYKACCNHSGKWEKVEVP